MRNIVLEAVDLVKIYNVNTENAFEALHGIQFRVYDGDFIAIMGPSGSGKSTFINTISTIGRPTHGKVYIHNTDVSTMSEEEIGKFRIHCLKT